MSTFARARRALKDLEFQEGQLMLRGTLTQAFRQVLADAREAKDVAELCVLTCWDNLYAERAHANSREVAS